MTVMTPRERRAERQRRFVTDKEARLAARLARLDYKVTNENGAMRVHTHSLTWHLVSRPNGTAPPPGRGWDRSGPARVTRDRGLVALAKPSEPQRVAEANSGTSTSSHI